MILQNLLTSRENRVKRQKELIERYNTTVISFTLNIPGPIKDKLEYREILDKGVDIITHNMKIIYMEVNYQATGPEAYICVEGNANDIKMNTICIEENHFAGRLFDIDVINKYGDTINREKLGMPLRKCLICDEAGIICARARKHNLDDLMKKVTEIILKEV